VLGGDGRYHNLEALHTILRIAAANDVSRMVVGQHGLLSTPAVSNLIRWRRADGGIILTASHNAGGPQGDFGIKFNVSNGGPAPESVTDRIARVAASLQQYSIEDAEAVPLDRRGTYHIAQMQVEVVDPVADYVTLLESLFDFDAIREMFYHGFRIRFDAMHAVTGPYAVEILQRRLGAPDGSVMRGDPRPDFGGEHPDPNVTHAAELAKEMFGSSAPDFGAASDGDGDRNLILGQRFFVTPSDSLAVLAANATLVRGYRSGLPGVARSMPTSQAVDRVAEALGFACYETPTGWKFFGNLMDAGLVALCGEESFGTGSSHVREKDGLWAVLFWLNILAIRRQSVEQIVRDHWRRYGRHCYTRHDYEEVDVSAAADVFDTLRSRLPSLTAVEVAGDRVTKADEFSYRDPVDGSHATSQGLRILFASGARIVFRLSGTGTTGATLRIYVERFVPDATQHNNDPHELLAPYVRTALEVSEVPERTGRSAPTVVS
jgi:phosphoglucomutase